MAPSSRVLLYCCEAKRSSSLRDALVAHGFEVTVADGALPEKYACEVIIADQADLAALPRRLRAAQTHGLVGLIQLNVPCGADVVLPADGTDRETVLACKLLVEIVRLRRDRHRERDSQRELRRLAHEDAMTLLPNRRQWDRELERRLRADRDHPAALALFDVDEFKGINSELGLPGGDRVLAAIGRSLAESVRDVDLVARLGGDEFGLLLTVVEMAHVPNIVERVRRLAGQAATRAADRPVSLSAGLVVAHGLAAEQLVVAADRSLRAAKSAGRDRMCQDLVG